MSFLAIVIVAYNSGEVLGRCLEAVSSQCREVVVVDNASPDRQTATVCGDFPHVELIERSQNGGFATAANEGVAATNAPWVLLLNPDAWPLADAVEAMLRRARRDASVGALGPLLVDEGGRRSRSTIRPPLSTASLALWAAMPERVSATYGLWRRATRRGRRERLGPGEFIQAAALLVRRSAFEQVGGFDESFFMYGEDADLCAGLRAAGWNVEICRDATFVHLGGGSSRGQGDLMRIELLRSWLRLIAKRDGLVRAERARRWLHRALRLAGQSDAAAWAASGSVGDLLGIAE